MDKSLQDIINIVRSRITDTNQVLIGIAGAPGSGKSTTCKLLKEAFDSFTTCQVIPMDGYHYTREQLKKFPDPELAFKRRGSFWTFDGPQFVRDLYNLKQRKQGKFPSFDHAIGDPIVDDIVISSVDKVILVEGNYLLIEEVPWIDLKHIFNMTIFLNANHDLLRHRIVTRHMTVGLSLDEATERFETNDLPNAIVIEQCKRRADIVVTVV